MKSIFSPKNLVFLLIIIIGPLYQLLFNNYGTASILIDHIIITHLIIIYIIVTIMNLLVHMIHKPLDKAPIKNIWIKAIFTQVILYLIYRVGILSIIPFLNSHSSSPNAFTYFFITKTWYLYSIVGSILYTIQTVLMEKYPEKINKILSILFWLLFILTIVFTVLFYIMLRMFLSAMT